MNILCIGDIFGKAGRRVLEKKLPELVAEIKPDLIIANAENIAHGKGMRPRDIDFLKNLGIDVITGGNHSFDQKEIIEVLEKDDTVLRPLNYPKGVPGKGFCVKKNCLIINAMGRIFMPEGLDSPFQRIDKILQQFKEQQFDAIILDIHAETTSEKSAIFHYYNGKIPCIFGTHSHVPTADAFVSELGSGFITDVGMTGPLHSIIGMEVQNVLDRFRTGLSSTFHPADGKAVLRAVSFEVENGKTVTIQAHQLFE